MKTSFHLIERDLVDGGRVINVGQPPSFHSLNPINTKHQETLSKNESNFKTKIQNCHQHLQRKTKLTPTTDGSRVTQQHHQH